MRQLLCRAHIVILFFYFSIVGNVNLLFFLTGFRYVTLNSNFIKLNEQAEKFIKLNFRMVNLNGNMVNVNKKSYII